MPAPYPPYAPYAEQHKTLAGPDDARPSALQIIRDEKLINGLTGLTGLVTGCTSGIGVETARALYAAGMAVYMTARTTAKGQPILDSIVASEPTASGKIHILEMELGSFASVRAAAAEFLTHNDALSIFVANAGVMATPRGTTEDGYETQFGTNHLGHFLLLQLLLPALAHAAKTAGRGSRVVFVSSSGHRRSSVRMSGDYDFEGGKAYDPWDGYGQAKTANIWTANELERRYGAQGVHGFSLHPGGILTPLQRHLTEEQIAQWKKIPGVDLMVKSPRQGAATSVWAATAGYWEGKGGVYLEDCSVALPKAEADADLSWGGHAEYAYNAEGERRLWEDSLKMVGLEEAKL
jgi:NAD(P)-dependent dehydrogenase (short-subunit alcohol dehydrogenase family)